MNEELCQTLKELTAAIGAPLSIDLVDVDIKRHGKNLTIEIRADKPQGGITVDECADINKKIIAQIEESVIIDEPYTLTVSSPGIDWPLTTEKDFLRVLNKKVRFHLKKAVSEKVEYSGTVHSVSSAGVVVKLKEKEVMIPIQSILKAVQII